MHTGHIDLVWSRPFGFSDFVTIPEKLKDFMSAGIYLWVEEHPDGEQLSYVGKATGKPDLIQRHQQHYSNYIGGRYTIPARFRSVENDWIPGQYPNNSNIVLDVERFVALVREAFEYTKHIKIYLAPKPGLNGQQLAVIERNLLYDLTPMGTIPGTKSEPKNRIKIIHKHATWCSEDVRRHIRNQPMIV